MTPLPIRVGVVVLALYCAAAFAQTYPTKPLHLVVPVPAGAIADAVARITAQALSQNLGQPVIVDNKPGADGAIAALSVINAPADGYSLFLGIPSVILGVPTMRRDPPFDPLRDFTAISLLGRSTFLLYVHPSVPAKNLRELISYAQAHPRQISYGSGNTIAILMTSQLARATGIDMVHVPYKGDAQAIPDLLAGRIQLLFSSTVTALTNAKEGKLRLIAAVERSTLAPDVPTMAEAGVAVRLVDVIWGLYGPANLPGPVTSRLARELNSILQDREVREQLGRQGFEAAASTPSELASMIKEQLQIWADITPKGAHE